LDLIEIDAASNRGIDEIRDLKEKIRFAPNVGKYKIYIIDEVHMLTREAFNALLKTLEEPPSHAMFILATTEVHKVPLTILSRCQRFDFHKINSTKMLEGIKKIVKKEKIDIDDNSIRKIIILSDGSIRDALSFLDQIHAFSGDKNVDADLLENILGYSKQENLVKILSLIEKKDIKEVINFINKLIDEGIDLDVFLNNLIRFIRQVLLIKIDKDLVFEGLIEEDRAEANDIATKFSLNELIELLELISETSNSAKFSFLPQLYLELAIVKFLKKNDIVSTNDVSEATHKLKTEKQEIDDKKSEEPVIEKKPEQIIQKDDNTNWDNFLQIVKKNNISIYMALQGASFLNNKDSFLIKIYNQFYYDRLNDQKNYVLLQDSVNEYLGVKKKLEIIKSDKEKNIKKRNIIAEAISVFGGEIIN